MDFPFHCFDMFPGLLFTNRANKSNHHSLGLFVQVYLIVPAYPRQVQLADTQQKYGAEIWKDVRNSSQQGYYFLE